MTGWGVEGQEIRGKLAGVSFELRTSYPRFAAYARDHLHGLLDPDVRLPCQVSTWLQWEEGQPRRPAVQDPALRSMVQVDRDLFVGERVLEWFRVDDLRDLFLKVRLGADQMEVTGRFFFRVAGSRWTDRLRRLLRWRQVSHWRQRRFPTLVSYLVYYPCWWLSEMRGVGHPIHAAGVETPHGVVLFAGASGVGKSTLAIALAAEEGNRLLSDSFVLQRGKHVVAVPEPILLDRRSQAWLGPRAQILVPFGHRYLLDRIGFHVPESKRSGNGEVYAVVFPRRGPSTYVRPIEPRLAHQWLSIGNLMVNDLRRYWAFAAVWENLVLRGLVSERERQLAALVEGVRCFELSVAPNWSCEDVLNSLCVALERKPHQYGRFV